MRLGPLDIILNKDFKPNKKFYLVSGNESTLIQKITGTIIEKYQEKEIITVTKINSINNLIIEAGLFEDKKIYLIKGFKEFSDKTLNNHRMSSNVFIFVQENTQKLKKIKSIFLKDEDCCLIDCYELDKNSKIKIFNEFLKSSNFKIEKDLYWELIEKLDNKYAFLENSLNKISLIEKNDISLINIKKLLTIDDSGKEKVFFSLFKKNKEIVSIYREKIKTTLDVNEFYYYCRSLCQLIIDCENVNEYNKKIPVYLFKEKDYLIDLYKKYNSEKKKMLLRLLLTTETVLRKESGLSLIYGLRFLLKIKSIAIS